MFVQQNTRICIGSLTLTLLFMASSVWGGGRMDKTDLVSYIRHHPSYTSAQKPRTCQIYSRSTKKHIQILPKKVVASGEHGNEFALLEKTSIMFGVVTIRGVKSRRYLCMSKRGKLLARRKISRDGSCHFIENITSAYWTSYKNQKHESWYIGFNGKSGKPKKGRKTRENQEACNFLIRPPDHSDLEVDTVPDHMQAVVDNLRRKLQQTHGLTRKRRHRFQTEDPIDDESDDVFESLPEWARRPPQNASPEEKNEWVLRVQSIIDHLQPKSPMPDSTPSSYDADLAEPATSKPIVKGRQRTRNRSPSKKSRIGRGKNSRSKSKQPTNVGPTFSPSRRKLRREIAVPKTPMRQSVRDEEPSDVSTVASPSFSKVKNKNMETVHENDSSDLEAIEPHNLRHTDVFSKRENENNDFSAEDDLSRTPKVASARSRRKSKKTKPSRHRQHIDA